MQDLGSSNQPSSGPLALKPINSIRYSPSGARAVSGSDDGSVHVWDVRTGALVLGPLPGHDQSVESVDYSPSDQYVISGSGDGTLRIWDASTGKDIHGPIQAHSKGVRCVRFSPDSSVAVSGSDDGTVRIWNVTTGQHVMQLLQGDHEILSVGFSPDGHNVVCGSGEMHVVDRHTGNAVIEPITGHSDWINSAEFSPDGKRLVSGSEDETVRIWDAETGKHLVVCGDNHGSHSYPVTSVGFSPNGLFVVSGSLDDTVCVWDAQDGKRILGPLRGHTNWVNCVEFSPDGSHIVSCSHDATIRFWDATSCTRAIEANISISAGAKAGHTPSLNGDSTHDLWSVDDDGWAVDSHNRRLVWVPSDLRESLLVPPKSLTISSNGCYELRFEGANVGEKWADCYRP
ncbi:Vegetative incompatibility protein HET-E-1 [Rhizoctonia solani AG-1 IB]|uniref:Vegetative incompatibility protein HET-E-1 n=2 Tax=Thanatephorus cucumeris (strain AG1-IB / isolate 7/3/14) TaxID=1108050 RepID=M5C2G7_THACB|nr:Vegetative incompatibility protein HET-E-1 [Rhizoctonia solani AG-1 IB]